MITVGERYRIGLGPARGHVGVVTEVAADWAFLDVPSAGRPPQWIDTPWWREHEFRYAVKCEHLELERQCEMFAEVVA